METVLPDQRRRFEAMQPDALAEYQLQRLNRLLQTILPHNEFYAEKLADVELPLRSLDDLEQFPATYKEELLPSRDKVFAANLTYPREKYVRYHQTSGTRGRPMVVLDTEEDWQWWLHCWQFVLDAAEITADDTIMMAFSFGPFIGFWSAHDAATQRGCLVLPGGGLSSLARLEMIRHAQATALFCTPSYALHLAEVALQHGMDPRQSPVRRLVLAGEPGGSVPAIRDKIEAIWGAKVLDHSGASEVGPWGYGDLEGTGLYVLESEFIAELLSVETGTSAVEGELAELVITSLGRSGFPVIRYRTGDLVRPYWNGAGPNRFVMLKGGVLGRSDDMMIIRGVNIFPSSVEQILRSFPEIVEYRLTTFRASEMDQLEVEIEDRLQQPQRVAEELRLRLGLRIDVRCVPLNTLPRFEGKGKRFIDKRKDEASPAVRR
ncbi:MAG: phenylacetate--CoA ligase family protein [Pirellulales bacterium]